MNRGEIEFTEASLIAATAGFLACRSMLEFISWQNNIVKQELPLEPIIRKKHATAPLGRNEQRVTFFFMVKSPALGGMAERLKATVLKTVVAKATVGSNPTPSAPIPNAPGRCQRGRLGSPAK